MEAPPPPPPTQLELIGSEVKISFFGVAANDAYLSAAGTGIKRVHSTHAHAHTHTHTHTHRCTKSRSDEYPADGRLNFDLAATYYKSCQVMLSLSKSA